MGGSRATPTLPSLSVFHFPFRLFPLPSFLPISLFSSHSHSRRISMLSTINAAGSVQIPSRCAVVAELPRAHNSLASSWTSYATSAAVLSIHLHWSIVDLCRFLVPNDQDADMPHAGSSGVSHLKWISTCLGVSLSLSVTVFLICFSSFRPSSPSIISPSLSFSGLTF